MRAKYTFLNLLKIKFPVTAIVSILHRISGVIIFLLLPVLLYCLQLVTQSEVTFNRLMQTLHQDPCKILFLSVLAMISYHTIAGIRHLLMDCGLFEHKNTAKKSSWLVFVCTIIFVILMGLRLWSK